MQDSVAFDIYEGRTLVGRLSRLETGHYDFEYAASYVRNGGHELCVTMPTAQAAFRTATLHPFFTNYLSEGWAEDTQKRHLGGNFSPTTKNADLISAFGNCFGAITFRVADKKIPLRAPDFEPDPKSGFEAIETEMGQAEEAMIPGVHPKLLVRPLETGAGYRLAHTGEMSTHIAKITHKEFRFHDVLQNELLATAVTKHLLPDDEVCELSLANVDSIQEPALIIKRFDRNARGKRTAFYEFNQLLGKASDEKYDGSFAAMVDFIYERAGPEGKNGFKCEISDARKLFRRALATILIGNTDAHFKNFALMEKDGRFKLTPNYDLVSTSMYCANRKEKFTQFSLMLGGKQIYKLNAIDAKRLIMFAFECQIRPAELLEDVQALGKRIETLDRIIAPFDTTSPAVAAHIRSMVKSRWNGGFQLIEAILKKNPPKNTYALKTSRALAEKALSLVRPSHKQERSQQTAYAGPS